MQSDPETSIKVCAGRSASGCLLLKISASRGKVLASVGPPAFKMVSREGLIGLPFWVMLFSNVIK